jgi:hypothetical protein
MHQFLRTRYFQLFASVLILGAAVAPAGAVEYKPKKPDRGLRIAEPRWPVKVAAPASHKLESFYDHTGALFLSIDGMGTDLSFGTVEVEKPEGGVVRRAFLVAAATGGYSRPFEDGEVRVDGHRVMWERTLRNAVGSSNALADVTGFVESRINTAPAGRVLVDIAEDQSDLVDGVVLAVIFEVPSAGPSNHVSLYFGAQAARADSFIIPFSKPAPRDLSDDRYDLSLGISFSLQSGAAPSQSTVVDINGKRLTTSAGGPDDGSPTPGALLTVGGVDDTPDNPPDAFAEPVNLASDDELYDLRPFIAAGDTAAVVKTSSPSSEENIFFMGFFEGQSDLRAVVARDATVPASVSAAAAPAGSDGVFLAAKSASTSVGAGCEITADVRRNGIGVSGAPVELRVIAGPHSGAVSRATTDGTGVATFLYRGKSVGRDLLVAVVSEGEQAVAGSNVVAHDWTAEVLEAALDISPGVCPNVVEFGVQEVVTVALVGSENFDVESVDITSLFLEKASPLKVQYRDVSQPGTGSDCPCSDEGGDGYRDIVLQFRLSDVVTDAAKVADQQRLKWTLIGSRASGTSFELSDCVVASKVPAGPIQLPENVLTPVESDSVRAQTGQ